MSNVVLVYANNKESISRHTRLRIAALISIGYTVKIIDSSDWKSTQGLKVINIIVDEFNEEY